MVRLEGRDARASEARAVAALDASTAARAGVAAFPSYTAADIVNDAHLNQRGAVRELTGPEGERRKIA
ncbi:MAG TPA: hypothetical protein PLI12_08035, partial [Acetobacteraceae bacterium]|nr:hypothetical protein [Acetobacteraceae bacterium]